MTTYIEHARAILARRMGNHVSLPKVQEMYLLLMLTTGEDTTARHVHNAWAVARRKDRADSPFMVPFSDLPPDVAAVDEPYAEIIRAAAHELRNS